MIDKCMRHVIEGRMIRIPIMRNRLIKMLINQLHIYRSLFDWTMRIRDVDQTRFGAKENIKHLRN